MQSCHVLCFLYALHHFVTLLVCPAGTWFSCYVTSLHIHTPFNWDSLSKQHSEYILIIWTISASVLRCRRRNPSINRWGHKYLATPEMTLLVSWMWGGGQVLTISWKWKGLLSPYNWYHFSSVVVGVSGSLIVSPSALLLLLRSVGLVTETNKLIVDWLRQSCTYTGAS